LACVGKTGAVVQNVRCFLLDSVGSLLARRFLRDAVGQVFPGEPDLCWSLLLTWNVQQRRTLGRILLFQIQERALGFSDRWIVDVEEVFAVVDLLL